MRIAHTSDIHLDSRRPERLEALKDLLVKAGKKEADLLVISGDLFDSSEQADILRPGLRKLFSSTGFEVLAIPGNHDMDAYRSDLNFGDRIDIAARLPFDILDRDRVRIVAVPYANQVFNDIAAPLREAAAGDRMNILVIHCSLDIPHLGEDEYGEEKRQAYLPINSRVLGELGFDYVLAGHFHSRTVENRLSQKTTFFYSGSPVSITRKETARRTAVILDTDRPDRERTALLDLDSFYYDHTVTVLEAGREDEGLKRLEQRLAGYRGHRADVEAVVTGFVSRPEKEISARIKEIAGKKSGKDLVFDIREEYRDITAVLDDPLYQAFRQRLKEKDLDPGLKKEIEEMVTRQFSRIEQADR